MHELLKFYRDEGPELVGVVMQDGAIVEVENRSPEPNDSCVIDPAFLAENDDKMKATFHTHPGKNANLSGEDYQAFSNWPDLLHYIIGSDGLRCYEVLPNGAIAERDQDRTPRTA